MGWRIGGGRGRGGRRGHHLPTPRAATNRRERMEGARRACFDVLPPSFLPRFVKNTHLTSARSPPRGGAGAGRLRGGSPDMGVRFFGGRVCARWGGLALCVRACARVRGCVRVRVTQTQAGKKKRGGGCSSFFSSKRSERERAATSFLAFFPTAVGRPSSTPFLGPRQLQGKLHQSQTSARQRGRGDASAPPARASHARDARGRWRARAPRRQATPRSVTLVPSQRR